MLRYLSIYDKILKRGGDELKYNNIIEAKFISRPNRFIALVDINGKN